MKRLFFALWPDEVIRGQCMAVTRQLKDYGRPVSRGNYHATLLFLGATSAEQERLLSEAADGISVESMSLTFDRLVYWKKPAVACLLSQRFDSSVSLLAEQLHDAAEAIGLRIDTREFKPHITLLRKSRPIPDVNVDPILWRTNRFCLVESRSSEFGVIYQVVKYWGGSQW